MLLLLFILSLVAWSAAEPVKVYAKCVRDLEGLRQYEISICSANSAGFEVFCLNLKRTYRCDGMAWRKQ